MLFALKASGTLDAHLTVACRFARFHTDPVACIAFWVFLALQVIWTEKAHLAVANDRSGWVFWHTDTVTRQTDGAFLALQVLWTKDAFLTVANERRTNTDTVSTSILGIALIVRIVDTLERIRTLQSGKPQTGGLTVTDAAAIQIACTVITWIFHARIPILALYILVALTKRVRRFVARNANARTVFPFEYALGVAWKFHTLSSLRAIGINSIAFARRKAGSFAKLVAVFRVAVIVWVVETRSSSTTLKIVGATTSR